MVLNYRGCRKASLVEDLVEEPIPIGISACLLGEKVRYDGGHALDRFVVETLGQFVEFVPVCPEVEFGLSVPREPMRLVGDPDSPRLITTKNQVDYTDRMLKWAKKRVTELESQGLCGFIFKSKSPSSGMERVKVYNEKGIPSKKGVGLFARVFHAAFSSGACGRRWKTERSPASGELCREDLCIQEMARSARREIEHPKAH